MGERRTGTYIYHPQHTQIYIYIRGDPPTPAGPSTEHPSNIYRAWSHIYIRVSPPAPIPLPNAHRLGYAPGAWFPPEPTHLTPPTTKARPPTGEGRSPIGSRNPLIPRFRARPPTIPSTGAASPITNCHRQLASPGRSHAGRAYCPPAGAPHPAPPPNALGLLAVLRGASNHASRHTPPSPQAPTRPCTPSPGLHQ